MRHLFLVLTLLWVGLVGGPPAARAQGGSLSESDGVLRRAFEQHTSNIQVEGRGVVRRVLPDDDDGTRHQRFILQLASGQTLLVAHNVDIAPRIPGLRRGDRVAFRGEYEWSPQGGTIHWTHNDPAGRHPGGWLRRGGKTYR